MSIYKPRKFWCFKCKMMTTHFFFHFVENRSHGWFCIGQRLDPNGDPVGEPTIEVE